MTPTTDDALVERLWEAHVAVHRDDCDEYQDYFELGARAALAAVSPPRAVDREGMEQLRKRAFPVHSDAAAYIEALQRELAHIEDWRSVSVEELLRTEDRANAAEAREAKLQNEKDGAYCERNYIVAALSKLFPAGTAKTAIPGWEDEWHGCVYIDLPTGQVSWHYHDSQAHLFAHLPAYAGQWDGHDTVEKYRRLGALAPGAS